HSTGAGRRADGLGLYDGGLGEPVDRQAIRQHAAPPDKEFRAVGLGRGPGPNQPSVKRIGAARRGAGDERKKPDGRRYRQTTWLFHDQASDAISFTKLVQVRRRRQTICRTAICTGALLACSANQWGIGGARRNRTDELFNAVVTEPH